MIGAGALLTLVGCGGTGTVSGKVTLNGKPVPGGAVTIHDSEGQSRNGGINKDGTYSVSNLAPGPAKVSVFTAMEMKQVRNPEGGAKNPLGEFVAIPDKYRSRDTSGLTLDVKSGKQDYDVKMEGEAPAAETKQ
jgi:hypothetical protein